MSVTTITQTTLRTVIADGSSTIALRTTLAVPSASQVAFAPTSGIEATNVQAAIGALADRGGSVLASATSAATFELLVTHRTIEVDSSGGNVSIQLPDPDSIPDGWEVLLQKVSSETSSTITLLRFDAETIQGGAANYALPDGDSANFPGWTLRKRSGGWFVV